jgi:2',3'-cyclic-nucleotide 2'-phosphodiesterase (5'-nucleotidase family)
LPVSRRGCRDAPYCRPSPAIAFVVHCGKSHRSFGRRGRDAAYVDNLKQQNPATIVVSAGDLIGSSPLVSALFHDEGTIESMNRLGLDFNAVGQTLFAPYGIKVVNGVRVGFIGLTLKETPTIVTPSGVAGLSFLDEIATANSLVPKLRARGVATIVVLIHQGGSGSGDIKSCSSGARNSSIGAIVSGLDDAVMPWFPDTRTPRTTVLCPTKQVAMFPSHRPVRSASARGNSVRRRQSSAFSVTCPQRKPPAGPRV